MTKGGLKPHSLCLPSIEGEIYCFTSNGSFVRPSVPSMRSPRLSFRRSNTRRWPSLGPLLVHRLQRLANISPVFGYRVVFNVMLNVGQRHRRRANNNPAFASSSSWSNLNRPKSLKNKQKTATKHTGTLECWYPTSLVLTNVSPLSTTLPQN